MGRVLAGYLLPHPPIIMPQIGKGEEKKACATIEALKKVAGSIESKKPDTILIITPHGSIFRDAISVSCEPTLSGSFKKFGCPNISIKIDNNVELSNRIVEEANKESIPTVGLTNEICTRYGIDNDLDHGALVPLYYITEKFKGYKIAHISIGFLSYEQHFSFGQVIKSVIEKSDNNVVVVASGDLSHCLMPGAPCGYNKIGAEFDSMLVKKLTEKDFEGIISFEESFIDNAAECGLRPLCVLFGAISQDKIEVNVLSYEGPYGVGYCVAEFNVV